MVVKELTNHEFEEFLKGGIVFIDFFADWCMPCIMMSPIVDEMEDKFNDKIKFGKIDIANNPALADKYKVSSIPNMIIIKDGKIFDRIVGAVSAEELEEKLTDSLRT
ncbi:thioredoxin [archaeon]|jgi:thioredoxin 1|nr:thioredoxin [archaeon]MBT4373418.1 thioredoxin [archaeon]MBT4531866.1 thioredoxin [archaeon]MBT7001533.1 thioredoxin [archaeon]MBT7282575.1 thioredoxin [archaeon]